MACLPLFVLDEPGESTVNRASASLIDPRVRHGGEEGMSEADAFTVHAHDVRFDRRLKCQAGFDAECARHARQLWLGQAGGDKKCLLRLGRKDGDASLEEFAERPRNGQSPTGDVRGTWSSRARAISSA